MDAEEIKRMEKKHVMQTYDRADIVFERGKGAYLYDANGKKYLDFVSGIATASLGHANDAVAKAISKQAAILIGTSNLYYTVPQAMLAKRLVELSGMGKCFFSNSGAEAIEAAIKLARKRTGRKEIISTINGFHGRTIGALSITGKEKIREPFEPLMPGAKFIPYNDSVALFDSISDETAAFVVEPIQGEAGIIVPSKGYLGECRKICDEFGALLIVDEIQTNMRTGKFFAFQHEKITPDIVTVAKGIAGGIPMGITIATDETASGFAFGDHGSTFGGNALSCAAANATIDFVLKNNLVEKAGENGEYFMGKLKSMAGKMPVVKDVRGKGLMIGVELTVAAKGVSEECLSKGLIVNKCSENVLRFLPSLIVTKKEIDSCLGILEGVLCEA